MFGIRDAVATCPGVPYHFPFSKHLIIMCRQPTVKPIAHIDFVILVPTGPEILTLSWYQQDRRYSRYPGTNRTGDTHVILVPTGPEILTLSWYQQDRRCSRYPGTNRTGDTHVILVPTGPEILACRDQKVKRKVKSLVHVYTIT